MRNKRHVKLRVEETSSEDLDKALDKLSDSLDKLESYVDEDSKDNKKYDLSTLITDIILMICIFVILMLAMHGWGLHDDFVDRCTEVIPAYKIESVPMEREYTHNGFVRRDSYYHTLYEFELDGELHKIGFSTTKPVEYNGIVDVYYNPDNHDDWYADASIFEDLIFINVEGNWLKDRDAGLSGLIKD